MTITVAPPQLRRPPKPEPGLLPAGPWVQQLVLAYLQVRTGLRPVSDLQGWVSTPLWHIIQRTPIAQSTAKTLIRSTHITSPTEGVIEAVCVVDHVGPPHAIALRLEAAARARNGYSGPLGARYVPLHRDGLAVPKGADRWLATDLKLLLPMGLTVGASR